MEKPNLEDIKRYYLSITDDENTINNIINKTLKYLNNNDTDLRDELVEIANNNDAGIDFIIKALKETIKKKFEGYIFLNSTTIIKGKESSFFRDEITKQEICFSADDLYKYEQYTKPLKYRITDLAYPITIKVILKQKKLPVRFKTFLKRVFEEAQKDMERIKKESKCNIVTEEKLTGALLDEICTFSHIIYNSSKYIEMSSTLDELFYKNMYCSNWIDYYYECGNEEKAQEYAIKREETVALSEAITNDFYLKPSEKAQYISEFVSKKTLLINKAIQAHPGYHCMFNNSGINDIMLNFRNISKGNKVTTPTRKNFKYKTNVGNMIVLEEGPNSKQALEQTIKGFSPGMTKTFCFLLIEHNKNKSDKIKISIDDYFRFTGLVKRSNNQNRFLSYLYSLQETYFNYSYKFKGKKRIYTNTSKCIAITDERKDTNTNKKELTIAFGDWIKDLNVSQYCLVPEQLFKIKEDTAFLLGLKIVSQIRNGLTNKSETLDLKVNTILNLLNISDNTIKAKGYTNAIQEPLEHYLDILKDNIGLYWDWKGKNNHNSKEELLNDCITFKCDKLLQEYNREKIIKTRDRKIKEAQKKKQKARRDNTK